MTDSAKIIIDGRELVDQHWATYPIVRDDEISAGLRRWQPDRTPPDPIGRNWLGQATSGEHLYWTPIPAVPAGHTCEGPA